MMQEQKLIQSSEIMQYVNQHEKINNRFCQPKNITSQQSKLMVECQTKDQDHIHLMNHRQRTQLVGEEKFNNLQSKLHQEAENIRKWKIATEIEIKHKDSKLQESTQIAEAQRKSLLELQLQNENLSVKLQEELISREDIQQKILATRELCKLVKDHMINIEEKILKCEEARNEFNYFSNEKTDEVLMLSEKIKEIMVLSTNKELLFNETFQKEILAKEQMEKEYKNLLSDANNKQSSISKDLQDTTDLLKKTEDELELKMEEITHFLDKQCKLTEENETLKLILMEEKNNNSDLYTSLKLSEDRNKDLEVSISQMNMDINEMTERLNKLMETAKIKEQEYEEKLKLLEIQLSKRCDELIAEKKSFSDVTTNFNEAQLFIHELKLNKDVLMREKNEVIQLNEELKLKICELEKEINNTKTDFQNCLEKCSNSEKQFQKQLEDATYNLTCEKNSFLQLQKQLESLTFKFDESEKQLKITNDDLSKEKKQNIQLKSELEDLSCKLLEKESNILKMTSTSEKLLENKKAIDNELNLTKEELNNKRLEIEQLQMKIKESEDSNSVLSSANKTMEELIKTEKEKQENELLSYKEIINLLEDKIHMKEIEIHSLFEKEKKLTGESIQKDNELLTMKEEVRTLQDSIEAKDAIINLISEQEKWLKSEVSEINNELKNLKEDNRVLQDCIQAKEAVIKLISDQLQELQQSTDIALKDKEMCNKNFEHQMSEMLSTLEKYKIENGKIVAQKEKQLQQLKLEYEEEKKKRMKLEVELLKELENKGKTNEKIHFILKEKSELIKSLENLKSSKENKYLLETKANIMIEKNNINIKEHKDLYLKAKDKIINESENVLSTNDFSLNQFKRKASAEDEKSESGSECLELEMKNTKKIYLAEKKNKIQLVSPFTLKPTKSLLNKETPEKTNNAKTDKKFFKSPRKTKQKNKRKKKDLSWLESDSIFGLGSD